LFGQWEFLSGSKVETELHDGALASGHARWGSREDSRPELGVLRGDLHPGRSSFVDGVFFVVGVRDASVLSAFFTGPGRGVPLMKCHVGVTIRCWRVQERLPCHLGIGPFVPSSSGVGGGRSFIGIRGRHRGWLRSNVGVTGYCQWLGRFEFGGGS
jgi:hypothetical protein